jgi:hypothetical protein
MATLKSDDIKPADDPKGRKPDEPKAPEPEPKPEKAKAPEPEAGGQPSGTELERLREERFGDGPGVIRVDHDLATGKAELIYVDGDGAESREAYTPKKGD